MYLSSIRILNYKGFLDSDELAFTPGFNIIVGKNNAGKTALMEALSLRFENKPHLSLKTRPTSLTIQQEKSTVEAKLALSGEELTDLLLDRFNKFFYPRDDTRNSESAERDFLNILSNPVQFVCEYEGGTLAKSYLHSYPIPSGFNFRIGFEADREARLIRPLHRNFSREAGPFLEDELAKILSERVYAFKAERFNLGVSGFGRDAELAPNASNLPAVLNSLQGDPERFRRFNDMVHVVFPEVQQISVQPGPSDNQVQIRVWTIDPNEQRPDLAIPLAESGTGIGQVLAILYVVLTSDHPRTIIIDEPQSFLHPGAIRKLLEILKRHYGQHQFIIATHSPMVLTVTNPSTIFRMRKQESESVVDTVAIGAAQTVQGLLVEVGARLSDVFGADNILWVEGPTEEQCFPHIVEKLVKRPLLGTAIIGVLHTGDLESKHARTVFEIYGRLSRGPSLLPPALGFIFDRENRTEQQRKELEHRSNGTVSFTPRRMYENYLLNPGAIAAIVSHIEGFREKPLAPREIEDWLQARQQGTPVEDWIKNVHGAEVLEDLFSEFSEQRVAYEKTVYGVLLTDWIIEHAPEDLREIVVLLEKALGQAGPG